MVLAPLDTEVSLQCRFALEFEALSFFPFVRWSEKHRTSVPRTSPREGNMVIDGTRQGMVHPAAGEGVPLELQIGDERVGVWLDGQGIHFQSASGGLNGGLLPWDVALAMALVPPGMQPALARPDPRAAPTRAA